MTEKTIKQGEEIVRLGSDKEKKERVFHTEIFENFQYIEIKNKKGIVLGCLNNGDSEDGSQEGEQFKKAKSIAEKLIDRFGLNVALNVIKHNEKEKLALFFSNKLISPGGITKKEIIEEVQKNI